MGQAEPQPRRYTVEEYLAMEEKSEVRHEFFEGEIFAMAGADISHNLIGVNLVSAFKQSLRGKSCRALMEGVQLAVQEGRHYTYPDVMITCDAADQQAKRIVKAPVLLIEILSPSTSEYDRGRKFNQYKQLPSLQHYLLVSQTSWLVEWYRREPGNIWSFTPLVEAEDALFIPDLNINLTVAEIYEGTDVAPLRVAEEPIAAYAGQRPQ
ncbi:Uma2 family endonuclease [Hymenobacter monticola]|uniref:Uma2 family endonuclease n=1 Tax=Hymenobacter monticola TaxID=1705399 RepID=A0ABY4BDM4_9BACT|nr:Uma2 family endonuclease [Hymenobacter monticola]UOE35893.1 Uma2 family endonuclease [Hymenobacter monticola]